MIFQREKKNENHSKLPKWKSTETIGTIYSTRFHTHRRQNTHTLKFPFSLASFVFCFFFFRCFHFSDLSASIDRTAEKIYHNIPILLAELGNDEKKKIAEKFSHRFLCVCMACPCVSVFYPKKENGYGGDLYIYIFNKQTLVKTLKIILFFVFFFSSIM